MFEQKRLQIKKIADEVIENLNGRVEPNDILESVFAIAFEHNMTNEDRNQLLFEVMSKLQKTNIDYSVDS
jgi:hypothetical protein